MITDDQAEWLFKRWATIRDSISTTSLGYPSKAPEARALEGRGGGISKSNVPTRIPGDRDVTRTGFAIAAMPEDLREYVYATYYLRASQRAIAEYLGCSRRKLGMYDGRAKRWLQCWLEAARRYDK